MFTTIENGPSIRELEREAERNREALLDSVTELQQRLSPTAIKHDVQDYVRAKKDSFVESLEQRARDNPVQTMAIAAGAVYPLWGLISRIPVPLLLIGAGFALSRRSANPDHRGLAEDTSFLDGARERLGAVTDSALEEIGHATHSVQRQAQLGVKAARSAVDRVSDLGTEVSEQTREVAARASGKLNDAAQTVRGISNEVVDRASELMSADRLRRAGTQANDWIEDTVSRNPLIVGAVGLAIGAVIAAALPKTRQEDQFLGSAAEHVKKRAQDSAAAGVNIAKDVAKDIYRDAVTSAKEQGLSSEGLSEAASDVADKLRSAVTGTLRGQNETQDSGGASSHSPAWPATREVTP